MDCKASPDNEFGFVRFFGREPSVSLQVPTANVFVNLEIRMFVVDRSALAVILPLMLLIAVVLWTNRPMDTVSAPLAGKESSQEEPRQDRSQTVAANLPSR